MCGAGRAASGAAGRAGGVTMGVVSALGRGGRDEEQAGDRLPTVDGMEAPSEH
ncbi:hypothetical protein I79_003115 [Cricetulus griseus]|uniref:Uncharacterized protein n=1 Tax=Cricetulus griseus TaxID=10029 RepID=G3GZ84_CRIGR|nr:hypothetical protein I79_003115 [Cricetulus griseus]